MSITISRSSVKLTSIRSVMLSNHLILCRPLLLLPIPPSIIVFSNESALRMRWPKYWSSSFSIIPSTSAPDLGRGVAPLSCYLRCCSLPLLAVAPDLGRRVTPLGYRPSGMGSSRLLPRTSDVGQLLLAALVHHRSRPHLQDQELTVAQIMNSLLPNSDLN